MVVISASPRVRRGRNLYSREIFHGLRADSFALGEPPFPDFSIGTRGLFGNSGSSVWRRSMLCLLTIVSSRGIKWHGGCLM